ncbi:MAG TPA: DegT/DnrJ/EryC1/StrS family aminotransferase [Bacteroidia bacterium]|nr:DegT/DnrJ/EryC1/StrS family aminotransferase [Bacteroidia bacterium]
MDKIQMVNLTDQHKKIQTELNEAIQRVIASSAFINGPEVKAFAAELEQYTGARHVIPCANGTDALQIAMMALGLQPGDEVIVPAFTYAATAEVIGLLGLTTVMVDVSPHTFNIEADTLAKAITPKTKAIVPVHLFGQCADMENILQLAEKHHLYVIEDTAQAIGAVYTFSNGTQKQAGTMGTIGTTSFFPSKNLGCMGDGGALFTNDEALAQKIKMIAHHGQSTQYVHEVLGVNSRLDSIQAAVLRVKLQHLNAYKEARQHVAAVYDRAFAQHPNLKIPTRQANSTHVFHQYTLQLCGINRQELRDFLAEKQIPTAVYYPIPLHFQKAYESSRYPKGSLPTTEILCTCVLSLPISTELSAEQQQYIIENILTFCTTKHQ